MTGTTTAAPTWSASAPRLAASRRCKSSSSTCPPDSGAAYVVILHLSPDHDSQLARSCSTPRRFRSRKYRTVPRSKPNHVYVVPAEQDPAHRRRRHRGRGHHAIGGAARAGGHVLPHARRCARLARGVRRPVGHRPERSTGLKRIKEYGGLVVVQDPDDGEVRRHAAQLHRHRSGRSRPAGRRDARHASATTTSGCAQRPERRADAGALRDRRTRCARSSRCCASGPATISRTTSPARSCGGSQRRVHLRRVCRRSHDYARLLRDNPRKRWR